MQNSYSTLLSASPSNTLSEKRVPYLLLKERHLQAVWYDQKLLLPLHTSQGEPVKVISPGIWNLEKGPDFLKAHLLIGQKELRGDIEIHLDENSWFHHQHDRDERYENVILHAVLWPSHSVTSSPTTKSGRPLPTVHLEPFLKIPAHKLPLTIDLDLYPYKRFLGSGQCASSVFHTLSDTEKYQFFASAALWRLEKKQNYLKERTQDPSLQILLGIAQALGYKHNAEAFLDVCLYFLDNRDLPEQEGLALVLGICGYFEPPFQTRWHSSPYYQELLILWGGLQSSVLHQAYLRKDGIRPLNHPIRRLVYLVKLLRDPLSPSLFERLLLLWKKYKTHPLQEKKNSKQLQKEFLKLIPDYPDPYWSSHFTFEQSLPTQKRLSFIGKDLKEAILINTFLPLLYAASVDRIDFQELEALKLFYSSFKSTSNSKNRYLSHRFFGDSENPLLLQNAIIEQGAYQLHKDFCLHYEASCKGCPFVDRFRHAIGMK